MKRLVLMRHAKSDWGDPARPDHARPLNRRGRRAATALGDWLCSTAARARETCTRLALPVEPDPVGELYLAEPPAMLAALRATSGDSVLMIGHNPGIAAVAARLVDVPPDHARFDDYPTGATLVADFAIDVWPALAEGTGHALAFLTPRELADPA